MTPYELHKKKWLGCNRCPLCEARKSVVLIRGKLPCDVLFLAEAPGINEDALGKPLIGPAGKKLDEMIDEAGGNVSRIRIAFSNVVACIPYDEDGRKTSEPPKEALKKCWPRVEEMLLFAKPAKIVAVGQVAAKQLKGALRDENVDLVTEIIHPAAILRANPAQQGLLYQKCIVTLRELFESLIPF